MGIRSRGASVPAGFEGPYHGGTVPVGWLLMFGQIVNIADYPRLFAAIGSVHGGDGVTTFGIPDSRGRVTVGKDNMGGVAANRVTVGNSGINGATLGAVGGGETVTPTVAEMPSHDHPATYGTGAYASGDRRITQANSSLAATSSLAIDNTGGGGALNKMNPVIVANKIIKY